MVGITLTLIVPGAAIGRAVGQPRHHDRTAGARSCLSSAGHGVLRDTGSPNVRGCREGNAGAAVACRRRADRRRVRGCQGTKGLSRPNEANPIDGALIAAVVRMAIVETDVPGVVRKARTVRSRPESRCGHRRKYRGIDAWCGFRIVHQGNQFLRRWQPPVVLPRKVARMHLGLNQRMGALRSRTGGARPYLPFAAPLPHQSRRLVRYRAISMVRVVAIRPRFGQQCQ